MEDMIDVFEALGWLNVIDHRAYLNDEVIRLIRDARRISLDDSRAERVLERLRNVGSSSSEPLEKAEVLLHCAAIGYLRAWFPRATCDARESLIAYDKDDHRRAVALWILGKTQWKMLQNQEAYRNWAEAKEIFKGRLIFFQHFPEEKKWYENRIRQMEIELVARPEEISTWLNHFEGSSLRSRSQQVVQCAREKICQGAYSNVYALMQDLQEAMRWSEELYEKAEIYLEFGLAFYQLGNIHFAIELLRKAVEGFFPGIGTYHKQVVARCMLGAMEWMKPPPHKQAITDWTRSMEEFESLQLWASRDNNQTKQEWYAKHHALLYAALWERLARIKTECKQNPKPESGSSIPEGNRPKPPPSTPGNGAKDLYQDLLMKVRWDRAIADRLIELERKKAPAADRNELIKRAIERWLRDN